jgi:hypothetical protein
VSEYEVTPTWVTRELPILRLALERLDPGERAFTAIEGIRAQLNFDVPTMQTGLRALANAEPPYIKVTQMRAKPGQMEGYISEVTERTRRELGS